jgi:putative hemolysin
MPTPTIGLAGARTETVLEVAIIAFLILLNGVFALSELAVVSSRRARLRVMAAAGRKGARRALELSSDPGRFLSTVQIGITLVGILAGAYSGATFGSELAFWLEARGVSDRVAEPLGFGIIVACLTYLSLIIGELVPKHLALRNAEGIACAVAPAMSLMSRIAAPLVWLLNISTRLVLRILGRTAEAEETVTEEEIKSLIAEAESAGVLEADEQRLLVGVMRLGDRSVKGVMTPRTEVSWLDLKSSDEETKRVLIETPHSMLPVGEGSPDAMVGIVQARDLLASVLQNQPLDIKKRMRPAAVVPDTMDALDVMAQLRTADVKMALVHDEYGHFEGLVTPADLLEAISGPTSGEDTGETQVVQRDDGSWLISGWMAVDEMADLLGIVLPAHRDYQTAAGFLLSHLQHLPKVGESVVALGWEFEVVDLDGRRIDRVIAKRLPSRARARF